MKRRPIFSLGLYLYLSAFPPCLLFLAQEPKNPKKAIAQGLIPSLEKELAQASPNYKQIERKARTALGRYYEHHSQAKSIKYEQKYQRQNYSALSKNALRLLDQLREKRLGTSYFLGEKPSLFRLHLILAKAYAKQEKPAKALAEYAAAFRYAYIEAPSLEEQTELEKLRADMDRQSEKKIGTAPKKKEAEIPKGLSKLTNRQKEERYLWMKKFFANEMRISEEKLVKNGGSQIQADALRFAQEFKSYQSLKKEYKKARGELALARLKEARGEAFRSSPREALRQREALKERWEQSRNVLERIRKGSYKSYLVERRKFHGDAIYQMALAVQHLDRDRKAFRARSKRASYLQGQGSQEFLEEKDLRPDSSAFRALLELAHKIDPFHLKYIRLLADENKSARKIKEAAFFTQLYLHQAQKQRKELEKLSPYKVSLAGLYMEQGNYSKAIKNYEDYLKMKESNKKEPGALKELADLHYKRSGNTQRAQELYEQVLQAAESLLSEDKKELKKQNKLRALRCEAWKGLAAISRRKQYRKKEKEYLEKARVELSFIEKEKERQTRELEIVKEELRALTRRLRKKEDENLQRRYYQLKDKEIVEKQEEVNWLAYYLKRLDLANILEQRAWLSYNKGLWEEAQGLYRLILEKGSHEQINRARQNLERIRLSQEDGKLRQAVLSPDFER